MRDYASHRCRGGVTPSFVLPETYFLVSLRTYLSLPFFLTKCTRFFRTILPDPQSLRLRSSSARIKFFWHLQIFVNGHARFNLVTCTRSSIKWWIGGIFIFSPRLGLRSARHSPCNVRTHQVGLGYFFLTVDPSSAKTTLRRTNNFYVTVARLFTVLYIEMLVIKSRGRRTISHKSTDVWEQVI